MPTHTLSMRTHVERMHAQTLTQKQQEQKQSKNQNY